MTNSATLAGAAQDAHALVGAELAAALAALRPQHVTQETLAAAVGVHRSVVQGWLSGARYLPAYALTAASVPRALRGRLVGWLVARLEESAPVVGLDAATYALLRAAGELVTEIATALADRRLTPAERAAIRARADVLHDALVRWTREDRETPRVSV